MATMDGLIKVITYQLGYNKTPSGKTPPAAHYEIATMIGPLDAALSSEPPSPPPQSAVPSEDEEEEISDNEASEEEVISDEEANEDETQTIESWKGNNGISSIHEAAYVMKGGKLVGFKLEGEIFMLDSLNETARDSAEKLLGQTPSVRFFDKEPAKSGDMGKFTVGTSLGDAIIVFLEQLTGHFSLYFSNTIQKKDSNGKVQKLIVSDYPFGIDDKFKADPKNVVKGLKDRLSTQEAELGVLLYPNYIR